MKTYTKAEILSMTAAQLREAIDAGYTDGIYCTRCVYCTHCEDCEDGENCEDCAGPHNAHYVVLDVQLTQVEYTTVLDKYRSVKK